MYFSPLHAPPQAAAPHAGGGNANIQTMHGQGSGAVVAGGGGAANAAQPPMQAMQYIQTMPNQQGQPCYVLVLPQGQPTMGVQPMQYMPQHPQGQPYIAASPPGLMPPILQMPSMQVPMAGGSAVAPTTMSQPPAYGSVFNQPTSSSDLQRTPTGSSQNQLVPATAPPPPPPPPPPGTPSSAPSNSYNQENQSVLRDDNNTDAPGPGNGSINPTEFWDNTVDGVQGAGGGNASDPACEAMIADLRKEKTDRSVRTRVLRLPVPLCMGMVQYLANADDVVNDLCFRERGIIVAHLVERLGAENTQSLLQYAMSRFMELALNQSGCIALPRIMSCVRSQHLHAFFDLTMTHLSSLIGHPFGNYIVKHFVSLKDPVFNQRLLTDFFAQNFVRTATNKYGSHVLEDVLRALTVDELYPFARTAFADVGALKTLAHDRYANYCIQTMFRVLATGDAHFHSWCVGQIIGAVRGSPYEQNIMKSAVAGYRGQQQALPPALRTGIEGFMT